MKQHPPISSGLAMTLVLGLSSVLAGCAAPTHTASTTPLQAHALGLSDTPSPAVNNAWWRHWNDPQLDHLIAQTLQGSPSMAEAQARVQRMQALSGLADAASLPQATLGGEFSRQRYSANGLFPPPIAGRTWSNDTLQAGVGWNPDLWGQHRAELASAIGQVRAAQADAAAAANALVHQVVRGHVALARLLAQRDVAERVVQQRQQMQQLVQQRREAGLDTRIEQAQSDSTLADAAAQAEGLKEQITLTRHQLAVLSGQAPQALDAWSPRLDALRLEAMPATLGADLLGRRPDVVAARERVAAAQAALQAAQALRSADPSIGATFDHYPDGTRTNRLLGLRISIPLNGWQRFDGEIGRALAQEQQSQDLLQKTRVQARSELMALMQGWQASAGRLRIYDEQIIPQATQVAAQAELAYNKGGLTLIDLLDARRTLRTTQLEALAVRNEHAKALGSWQLRSAPPDTNTP